jgi:hypothetical protein
MEGLDSAILLPRVGAARIDHSVRSRLAFAAVTWPLARAAWRGASVGEE